MMMKLYRSFSAVLCLALAAVLAFGGILVPSSASALNKLTCRAIEEIAENWFYVPSTLPDSVSLIEYSEWASFNYKDQTEFGKTCEITFVSGEEALKDALKYKTYTSDFYNAGELQKDMPMMDLYVDNTQLTVPGKAVFHVKIQSEHCVDEEDVTICVLSWEDQPLLVPREKPWKLSAEPDEIIEEDAIAAAAVEIRDETIIEALKAEGMEFKKGVANSHLHHSAMEETGVVAAWDNMEEIMANWGFGDYRSGVKVLNYGTAQVYIGYNRGNASFSGEVEIIVAGYRISGPKTLKPGESVQYEMVDAVPVNGRTFTFTCEGEGITFDPAGMTLTAAEDVPEGTAFTLTAIPSDGGEPAVLKGMVATGLFAAESYNTVAFADGFSVPVFSDSSRFGSGWNQRGKFYSAMLDETGPYYMDLIYTSYTPLEEFAEDPEVARQLFQGHQESGFATVEKDELIEIDGHPAKLTIGLTDSISIGILDYVRNNRVITVWVRVFPENGSTLDSVPHVTAADMAAIAPMITYNPAEAPITVDDGAITITAKNNETALSGGKKLAFSAVFANPDRVSKKNKNDSVTWSVVDAETGDTPADITIDAKGNLSAAKALAEVHNVLVKADSPVFHTSATYPVTVIPAAAKVIVEPAELFFYVGTDTPQTVKVSLDPDTVPPIGITWTPAKKDIVEITETEAGTVSVKPLSAGKTTVAVKEPGGKNAKLNVNVVAPVETLELTMSGKAVPGGTVTVKAAIAPKNAGNKNLEWSLDVGEEIATISQGKVKISKEAPAGTKLTVTCKALGAPEAVTATLEIEVTEK